MTLTLFALLVYVALQLLLGVWVSRRIRTEEDYLVAGRSLGPLMATSSIFATWFGAETCVGAAGEVYQHGLGAVSSDPFGYGACLLLFGLFFAGPLWSRGLTTLADLFRNRFSPGVERCVAVLLIPGSLFWASAQIRAFGHVLSVGGGVPEDLAIAIAAGIAVTYTAFGGLLADAYADLIQGGVLIACLLLLLVAVVAGSGGLGASLSLLSMQADAPAPAEHSLIAALDDWAVPIFGSLFAQELVSRTSASRSQRVATRSALVAACVYLLVGSIPVVLGAMAHHSLPGVASEQVLATLAQHHLGSFGYVVFAGALVSAILSTVDSALLVCGSLVSHNLAPIVLPDLPERQKVRLARVSVLSLSVVGYFVARSADSVHGLVEQASAFGSAGVCVAGTLGLHTRFGGKHAAYAALVLGAGCWLVADTLWQIDGAFLLSLAAALAGYLAVGSSGLARAWIRRAGSSAPGRDPSSGSTR